MKPGSRVLPSWDDPAGFADSISRQYRRDNWAQQDVLVEVWSEKGTMRGTLAPVLQEYGVTFRVMHGFTSADHGVRRGANDRGREAARRDPVCRRLGSEWAVYERGGSTESLVEYGAEPDAFHRIALNDRGHSRSAISRPLRPATSRSDPRFRWFISLLRHPVLGAGCALAGRAAGSSRVAIRSQIDWPAWERCAIAEQAETESLRAVLTTWSQVKHG